MLSSKGKLWNKIPMKMQLAIASEQTKVGVNCGKEVERTREITIYSEVAFPFLRNKFWLLIKICGFTSKMRRR